MCSGCVCESMTPWSQKKGLQWRRVKVGPCKALGFSCQSCNSKHRSRKHWKRQCMLALCTHRRTPALPLCPAGLHTLFKGLKSNPTGVLYSWELGKKASEDVALLPAVLLRRMMLKESVEKVAEVYEDGWKGAIQLRLVTATDQLLTILRNRLHNPSVI